MAKYFNLVIVSSVGSVLLKFISFVNFQARSTAMFREMNILIIVELFIFNHVFYVLSRRLNFTQPIKENLASELNYQNYLRDMSVRPKDIFYPSEEYYVENVPRNLQQLNRDNRNLRLDYRSLCETVSEKVEIKDQDYEYQPSQYYEVYCKGYSLLSEEERIIKPLEQVNLGTMHMTCTFRITRNNVTIQKNYSKNKFHEMYLPGIPLRAENSAHVFRQTTVE
ncbi:uncharacterized protein [Cardiocondyla obscurior]|uniref:uncharacterized protein isoform X3 n=1 Tax=Cardiocondyla obscurior TaxID=286306 RepID=UPI0039656B92